MIKNKKISFLDYLAILQIIKIVITQSSYIFSGNRKFIPREANWRGILFGI